MKQQILIVDDEHDLVEVLSEIFQRTFPDASIDMAYDGEDALAKASRTRYDLLVTDLNMPRMEGNDLIGILIQEFPDMYPAHIIVISGYINLQDERGEKKIENIHFLQKPFRMVKLTELAQNLLG